MPIKSLAFVACVFALSACGSGNGESDAVDAGDEAAAEEAQAAMPDGGGGSEPLVISTRTYTSGSATVKVTGFFEANGSSQLNLPASLTDGDQTWITYGVSGAPELNVGFTNSTAMAEHGITIGIGPYTVTAVSTSGECRTKVDVTPALVSGRYDCTGSTAYNKDTRQMGQVDIEVEFSAGS
jgi:hypothetical protein